MSGTPSLVECREVPGVGDRFNRSGPLGTAEAGGPWVISTGAFTTDGSSARVSVAAGATPLALLPTASSDFDASARLRLDALPKGDGAAAAVVGRAAGTSFYAARLAVQPKGQVSLLLVRSLNGTVTTLGTFGIGKFVVGSVYWVRLTALGTSVQAKAWPSGKVEPAWQLSLIDNAALAGTSVGFGAWAGSGLTGSVGVTADDFSATAASGVGGFAACPSLSASYSGLALGGHVFTARVTQSSNAEIALYPWTINPPAPTVTLTSTPPNPTIDTSASFAWTTAGIVGSTTCSLDGVTAACSSPKSYSGLALGPHSFTVTVGNVTGSNSASFSWTVNPLAPTVSLTTTPANPTTNTSASFAWTTSGVVSSTTCSLDAAPATACTSPASYPGLALGSHTFTVTVSNITGSNSANHAWTINPPAPTVSLATTPSNPTTDTSAEFAWTTAGVVASTTCSLDGAATSCSSPITYPGLALGAHSFTVTVDNVTGSNSASYAWTVNPPAPTIALTVTPTDPTTSTSASFEWTTAGVVSSTTCSLDGTPATPCASPAPYADLALGSHSFTVTVGNVTGSDSKSYLWTINPPAPTVSLDSKPSDPSIDTSPSFAWSTTGVVSSTTCSLDGGVASDCTTPASYPDLALGPHTFTVTVSNVTGSNSASHTWTINPPAPTVTIPSGPASPTAEHTATFDISVTSGGPYTLTCELDGSPPVSNPACTLSAGRLTLSGINGGTHSLTVTATNAGGAASASYGWIVPIMIPFAVTAVASPDQVSVLWTSAQASGNTSLAVDCGDGNFRDAIIGGCSTVYAADPTGVCSPPALPDPVCVPIQSGNLSGSLVQGFNTRIGCPSNNWASYPTISASDPRLVSLFVVDPAGLPWDSSNPIFELPIRSFVMFYVTGWDGGSICATNEPFPVPGSAASTIWGHFVP